VGAVIGCFGDGLLHEDARKKVEVRVATSVNALGDFGIVHHVVCDGTKTFERRHGGVTL
jgi:hypothetical protein